MSIDYHSLDLEGIEPKEFKLHRQNFLERIKEKFTGFEEDSVLMIKAGPELNKFDTDCFLHYFIQDQNFYYLTGCKEYKYYGMLDFKNEATLTLFVPVPTEVQKVFFRQISLDDVRKQYECEAEELTKMSETVYKRKPKKIYILSGINSDSNTEVCPFDYIFPEPYQELNDLKDYHYLIYECLADVRTVKTEYEINMYKWFVDVTVDAHVNAMKKMRPGQIERDVENYFWEVASTQTFCRNHPYEHICGSGENAAILHYPDNDKVLKDGSLILMDMGARLAEYCSDLTSTVPVNGKFTKQQKEIYEIVLKTNRTVIENMKVGTNWRNLHLLAEGIILEGLQNLGIIKAGFKIADMIEDRVPYYFMPHGLGHLLGLNCHDVGGYLSFTPEKSTKIGLNKLRSARDLVKNNIYTVEPGIYFNPYLLECAMKDETIAKYIDKDKFLQYQNVGGVRIEDNVRVTETGGENFSKKMPRTVEEIEEIMKHE